LKFFEKMWTSQKEMKAGHKEMKAIQRDGFLSQQVMKTSHLLPPKTLGHHARSTRLHRSMLAWQLSSKAIGLILAP
jgi:hypothetical protein